MRPQYFLADGTPEPLYGSTAEQIDQQPEEQIEALRSFLVAWAAERIAEKLMEREKPQPQE